MKTVCLLGSPRLNGNSSTIAAHFCSRIVSFGGQVETFALNKLSYRGCQACMTCKTKLDRCVLEDDLTGVLTSLRDADLLVMATPVYFGNVSSQLKGFIDRMYSFLVPDYRTNAVKGRLKSGKRLVFIQVQGRPDETKFADVLPNYDEFFEWFGFEERHLIRCWGVRELGEVKNYPEVFQRADALAQKLMQVK